MRVDLYLSTIGVVKRRSEAKSLADSELITINGAVSKASRDVKPGDIIRIGGARAMAIEALLIPAGSVRRDLRQEYYRPL